MILHDAATAWLDLIHAAVLWVETLAGVAAMLLCAGLLCIAPGARLPFRMPRPGTWQGRGAPRSPSRDSSVTETMPEPAQARPARRVPHWARTDRHDDYREAA